MVSFAEEYMVSFANAKAKKKQKNDLVHLVRIGHNQSFEVQALIEYFEEVKRVHGYKQVIVFEGGADLYYKEKR